MQLQITSDNLELTESMQILAENKISKLSKYFEDSPNDHISIRIVLNKSGADDMFKTKIDMDVGKTDIYGDCADYSLESSLIGAVDDVLRQYKKMVDKRNEKDWNETREMKRFDPSINS